MEEKKPSFIEVQKKEPLDISQITESNSLKWQIEDKTLFHNYNESKNYTRYSNLLDASGDNIIRVILELYFQSKTLDPKTQKVKEAIMGLMKTIEWSSKDVNQDEILSKIEGVIDYLNENRDED
jgi:tetrahydrodipicolinate N-succinyltransferase